MLKRTLLLACAALLLPGLRAQTQSVTLDGIIYTLHKDAGTASVSGHEGDPVTVAIPATVEHEGAGYRVTAVDGYAFQGCESLESIALPEGVTDIGEYAFRACTLLQDIHVPEGIQEIANGLFFGCKSLKSIILPSAISSIGIDAFSNCNALQSINIPEGVTNIGDGAFSYCKTLPCIALPAGLQAIGSSAFWCCQAINSITIPKGITNIGDFTFYGCKSLQSITLPEGLETIGEEAFIYCNALRNIHCPNGLQSIGRRAFYECTSLENITLPSTLGEIGFDAFYGAGLEDICCQAAAPPVLYGEVYDDATYARATLHVPADAADDYRVAEGWKQFLSINGDLPSTAIGKVATDAFLAICADGTITTTSPASITVYEPGGARVRHAARATSLSLGGLPRGIYVICVEQGRRRQVMKVAR